MKHSQSVGGHVPSALESKESEDQSNDKPVTDDNGRLHTAAVTTPACQRCRRLKRKCSKTIPSCNQCINAGVECSLEESSRAPVSLRVARKLEDRIAWLSRCVNERLPSDAPAVEYLETGSDISLISRPPNLQSEQTADGKTSTAWPAVDREGELLPRESPQSDGIRVVTPPSTRDGSTYLPGLHTCFDVNKNSVSDNAAIGSSEFEVVAGKTIATSSGHGAAASPKHLAPLLPSTAAGRRFVDAYFRHIHRAYPFMDREKVLKDVEAMGDCMSEGTQKMPTHLYMVMAIGCTTLSRVGQVSDDICNKFKISYSTVLEECLSKRDIKSVATLLLLGLHSLFDPQGISPYIITGILSRQVIALGISRSRRAVGSGLELQEVEARHRLYWSAFTLDRMVSASVGLPFGICDSNANVPLPGITLEEYASPERHYYTTVLQVNRHIIALRQLEENILQKIHLPSSYTTSNLTLADRRMIIQELRTQIENWYTQGCLVTPMERDQLPFHNTIPWLNYRYQNLLLLLYTPSYFNSPITMDHLLEMQRCAQKYIQLSAVLWQQRHLPMNWVTLCRFVAIIPILLYCVVRSGDGANPVKEVAILCATVLEAFPSHWLSAKRAAGVFRRLAMTSNVGANPVNVSLLPGIGGGPGSESGAGRAEVVSVDQIKSEIEALAADLLGESSMYCRAVDAAGDFMRERLTGQLLDGFRSDLPLDTSWLNENAIWNGVGDLSMEFV